MGKGVEGHCQVVERGGGFILGRRAMGGTPNDGWDLNRARWEKAETGPDTAATPCNVIESHSVVQIHYNFSLFQELAFIVLQNICTASSHGFTFPP